METETTPTRSADMIPHPSGSGRLLIVVGCKTIGLSRESAERIVQAAYDRWGIIATPSLAAEAERAEVTL